jgi:hypothetical protein
MRQWTGTAWGKMRRLKPFALLPQQAGKKTVRKTRQQIIVEALYVFSGAGLREKRDNRK